MKKFLFKYLGIIILFISCGGGDINEFLQSKLFSVTKVLDGNLLELQNGYIVRLLGVNPAPKSAEILNQKLVRSEEQIRLVLDSRLMRSTNVNDTIYAYVIGLQTGSLNGLLLREGYAAISFVNLSDSLEIYSNYYHESPINRSRTNKGELEAVEKDLILTSEKIQKHAHKVVTQLSGSKQTQHSSKASQLSAIWKHTYDNWYYIHDPAGTSKDTWRSAEETIDIFYNNGAKYSGDCDDFAILLASLARAVDYDSRYVTAGPVEIGGMGHAYAEFFIPESDWQGDAFDLQDYFGNRRDIVYKRDNLDGVPGRWVNLDWWSPFVGGRYYPGQVIKVYDDL